MTLTTMRDAIATLEATGRRVSVRAVMREAVKQCRVPEQTAYRWTQSLACKARLRTLLQEVILGLGRLTGLFLQAVAALNAELDHGV